MGTFYMSVLEYLVMRRIVPLLLALLLTISTHAARQPVRARHGMVVAMESIAADVGVSVLQKGGNAVDAAVAVGFAMAVTHPFAGNIGGGGYMLIRLADGRTTFIDFRERAPQKSSRNMYLDANGDADARQHRRLAIVGRAGHRARLRDRGDERTASGPGPRTWRPAVELATKGFPVSYAAGRRAQGIAKPRELARVEADLPEERRVLRRRRRRSPSPSWRRRSRASRRMAPSEFYEGETARRFAAEMAKHGGIITLDGSEELQSDRTHTAVGHVSRLHDHHVAAVEFGRHRAARDARHPRRHRLRKGRRRLGVEHSLPGRIDAPRLRRPQRIRRRSSTS
mgnify:CR=1 FL=1